MPPRTFTKNLIEALQDVTIIAAFGAIFDVKKLKILTDQVNVLVKNVELQQQKVEIKAVCLKIVTLEAYNRKENLINSFLPLEKLL